MQQVSNTCKEQLDRPFRNRAYIEIRIGNGADMIQFSGNDVLSFSLTDYVSPVTETLPSIDLNFELENYDQKFQAEDGEGLFEQLYRGMPVSANFGYQLDDGSVEWMEEPYSGYLKTWEADDSTARFTATDRFDDTSDVYYRGLYRPAGIAAYNLAVDIFQDMGVTGGYLIDPYLKTILIRNPMPPVKHAEALQILANACRCSLSLGRNDVPTIQSSFTPDMAASSANAMALSRTGDILNGRGKQWYALAAVGSTVIDGSRYFVPRNADYQVDTGYVSAAVASDSGAFSETPSVTITLEAEYTCFGLAVEFAGAVPTQMVIILYRENAETERRTVTELSGRTVVPGAFRNFDKMVLAFPSAVPGSRVMIANVELGDVTDYHMAYQSLYDPPRATRQDKVKSVSVIKTVYSESSDAAKQLAKETVYISANSPEYTVYFNNPSYDLTVSSLTGGVTCSIKEQSSYQAVLQFSGVTSSRQVEYSISGKEYTVNEMVYKKQHGDSGRDYRWSNPLVDSDALAVDLEEWLAAYYEGNIEYDLSYRGDPRLDAHDLLYLQLKNGAEPLIRGYQHTINYNGAWSGSIKARKVTKR